MSLLVEWKFKIVDDREHWSEDLVKVSAFTRSFSQYHDSKSEDVLLVVELLRIRAESQFKNVVKSLVLVAVDCKEFRMGYLAVDTY